MEFLASFNLIKKNKKERGGGKGKKNSSKKKKVSVNSIAAQCRQAFSAKVLCQKLQSIWLKKGNEEDEVRFYYMIRSRQVKMKGSSWKEEF